MTDSRRAIRLGAALTALTLMVGLFILGPDVPGVRAAAKDSGPCFVDGAAPAVQDASTQGEGENRLDAAERTVACRLNREVPPAERTDALRADAVPRTRTTERSQPPSSEEPG